MTPPAPGRFSTMKFTFSRSVSCAATRRPSVSALPPGANGTMIFTGFAGHVWAEAGRTGRARNRRARRVFIDRKSTRLNSSHSQISYAVFCLKKKKKKKEKQSRRHTNHQRDKEDARSDVHLNSEISAGARE